MKNLINEALVTKCGNATTTGTGTVDGTVLDMAGFDGVQFVTGIGTANAGNFVQVSQADNLAFNVGVEALDTKATPSSGDVVIIDVFQPSKRFVRCIVTKGVSSASDQITAFQYRVISEPVNNGQIDTRAGYTAIFKQSPAAA